MKKILILIVSVSIGLAAAAATAATLEGVLTGDYSGSCTIKAVYNIAEEDGYFEYDARSTTEYNCTNFSILRGIALSGTLKYEEYEDEDKNDDVEQWTVDCTVQINGTPYHVELFSKCYDDADTCSPDSYVKINGQEFSFDSDITSIFENLVLN